MNVTKPGIDLIKLYEGFRARAYLCSANRCTIGWGHTRTAKLGQTITVAEAEELLKSDVRIAELAVLRKVKVPLTQNQFDALVSFTFNLGESNLGISELLKLLNKGKFTQAANEFPKWNKVRKKGVLVVEPGLVTRRAAEAALFVS